MRADVLGHGEGPELVLAEDLGHGGVGLEELPVLWVLQVVLLDVGPELLDALGAGGLLLADDGGQLGAQLHGLGQAGSLGHLGGVGVGGVEDKIEEDVLRLREQVGEWRTGRAEEQREKKPDGNRGS